MSRIDDAPRARRYEASFAGSVAILAWPEDAARAAELRARRPTRGCCWSASTPSRPRTGMV